MCVCSAKLQNSAPHLKEGGREKEEGGEKMKGERRGIKRRREEIKTSDTPVGAGGRRMRKEES